jgi:shikimate dehydrogenase
VYDLVPRSGSAGLTPLLALASSNGARVRGGMGMLVHQGVQAFKLWTGIEAPVDVMKRAVE